MIIVILYCNFCVIAYPYSHNYIQYEEYRVGGIATATFICMRSALCFQAMLRHVCQRFINVWPSRTLSCPYARRQFSSTIAEPLATSEPKQYPVKIRQIVDEISSLTLLEVSELNELLKVFHIIFKLIYSYCLKLQKTLNISDAPMMAYGAMPVAPVEAAEVVELILLTLITI